MPIGYGSGTTQFAAYDPDNPDTEIINNLIDPLNALNELA